DAAQARPDYLWVENVDGMADDKDGIHAKRIGRPQDRPEITVIAGAIEDQDAGPVRQFDLPEGLRSDLRRDDEFRGLVPIAKVAVKRGRHVDDPGISIVADEAFPPIRQPAEIARDDARELDAGALRLLDRLDPFDK